jgi:hypothetical protein
MNSMRRPSLLDLVHQMRFARAEYLRLEDAWDSVVKTALASSPGSLEKVNALDLSKGVGQEVLAALDRYHASVAAVLGHMKQNGRSK